LSRRVEKIQVWLKSLENIRYFRHDYCIIPLDSSLKEKKFPTKVVEKIKTHNSHKIHFTENLAAYEIIVKITADPNKPWMIEHNMP
jgi:hypothetical protein